jgi:putative oxidoreductase
MQIARVPETAAAEHNVGRARVARWAVVYARLAIGGAFLSAVAGRFGLWHGTPGLDRFPRFIQLTAEVNSFMPPATIPFLAWAATTTELSLGLALIAGFRTRVVSYGAAVLLAVFGTAMALSYGPRSRWIIRSSRRQPVRC